MGGTIYSNQSATVAAGQTDSSTWIDGGTQTVAAGGTAVSASDQVAIVPFDATYGYNAVPGSQVVYGAAIGTSVYAYEYFYGYNYVTAGRASQIIEGGGVASASNLLGGVQAVSAGGTAYDTLAGFWYQGADYFSGLQYVSGVASGTTVSGGDQAVWSGGFAIGTWVGGVVVNGRGFEGAQSVFGVASATTVAAGGVEEVLSGGVATHTLITSGGVQYVYSGAAMDTTIWFDGAQYVYSGAIATSASIYDGGAQYVSSGGVSTSATIYSAGAQYVSSGGSASDTSIGSAGVQDVYAGGVATSTTISGGGAEYVSSGGVATSTTIRTDGNQYVYAGGVAASTAINAGDQYVSSGGSASNTSVAYAGVQDVYAGGVATNTTITSGGAGYVSSGGAAVGATISGDGAQYVSFGGSAVTTTVSGGGSQYVSSGGSTVTTAISSGGYQFVLSGGSATGTQIGSGGTQDVYAGGVATSTTIIGGKQDVFGAATSTTISGGTLVVESGGTAAGVNFAGAGGTLLIESGSTVSGAISNAGAGNIIDLANTQVTSAAITGTTLTVTESDNQTVTYSLGGSLPGTGVKIESDGSNGTDLVITQPFVTTLVSFNGADGSQLQGGLVADSNGDLFGATLVDSATGGGTSAGSVFEIARTASGYAGTPQTLAWFNAGTTGYYPLGHSSMIMDASGDLFGTANGGGPGGAGTVFEIAKTASGYSTTPQVLGAFNVANGSNPISLIADASGNLLGTTEAGGTNGDGVVFEIAKTATGYAAPQTVVNFTDANGKEPVDLIIDAAGDLIGTADRGGSSNDGVVFEIARTATGYASTAQTLATFDGADGSVPYAKLIADANGDLFGTTAHDGANGDYGTVFEIVKTATGYASTPLTLVSFDGTDGSAPVAGLITDAAGNLFGTTENGGANGDGTLFELAKTATGYAAAPTTLVDFNGTNGAAPGAGLIADANGNLFSTTVWGGASGDGTAFELTNSGFVPFTVVTAFTPSATGNILVGQTIELTATFSTAVTVSGGTPTLTLNDSGTATYDAAATAALDDPTKLVFDYTVSSTDQRLSALATTGVNLNGATVLDHNGNVPTLSGLQTTFSNVAINMASLITLASFDASIGNYPIGGLIMDPAGDLLGTTSTGGANGYGTVFEIARTANGYAGAPAVLASFGFDGYSTASLITDAAGDLFGTNLFGGPNRYGTVFEIARTASGYASTPTTLVSFDPSSGDYPRGALVTDAAGDLFGTTPGDGAYDDGSVFEITRTASGYASAPTILVNFNGSDGAAPSAGLITDAAGDLFGTAAAAGLNGVGNVFEIARIGNSYATTPTILANFTGSNGAYPLAGLMSDAAGDLFGTTEQGGADNDGTVFEIARTAGSYASTPLTLVNFNGTNGSWPVGDLIMDAAGNLFGITELGGASNDGTVFELVKTATGYAAAPTTLISFDGSDSYPLAGLVADADGNLFGTTNQGGASGVGTAFEVTNSGFVPLTATISGTAQEGQTLAANTVSVTPGATITYQWQELVGTTWTDIVGAAGATYLVQESAEGLQVRVQATNSGGYTATSGATAAVLDAAPTITTPVISGTAQEGQVLTASATAGQSDNAVSYAWYSSADGYVNAIGTGTSYQLQEADEGFSIEVKATATNDNGVTASATSLATAAVVDAAPTVSTPVISGTAQEGQVLTASASAGQSDNAVSYAWYSSADGYTSPIGTGAGYLVQARDLGFTLEVRATAVNDNGIIASATSLASLPVVPLSVTSVVANPATGPEFPGQAIALTATFSGAVAVSGGTPTLTLNDGGTAIYDAVATAALDDPDRLVFDYTVHPSDASVTALAATGVRLNGASIASPSGVAADLAGLVTDFAGLEVITAPPILALTNVVPESPLTATVTGTIDALDAGQTITIFDAGRSLAPNGSAWRTTTTADASGSWGASAVPWTVIDGSFAVTAANGAGVGLSDYVYGTVVANGASLGTGDFQYVYGKANGFTIDAGAVQEISVGGSVAGTMLYGIQIDWGTSINAALISGGSEYVFGVSAGTTIAAGVQYVEAGGAADGTTIDAGGQQILYSSTSGVGSAADTTIAGGSQTVYGAIVDLTTIDSGGMQYLFGSAVATTINAGGEQNVYSNGSATGTTVNTGGTEIVWGTDSNATVAGGNQFVVGTATGATVTAGTQYVDVGGTADGATIDTGGQQIIYSSSAGVGNAIGTTIDGGSQTVYGATVDQTTIDAGGMQYLFGTATNTTINSGGEQNVYTNGSAIGTTLNTNGTEIVWGTDSNATIAGGNQFVFGTATGTTITGGTQYVESGGSATGTTIDGGTEHVYSNGTANGVTFGGASGTLALDRASWLDGTVAGFQSGDEIDLSFVSFSKPGTTLGYSSNTSGPAGGTLTVTDGANTATLALLGQYAASSFALSSDGAGGTFVTEPAIAAQNQIAPSHV